ncbi:helix-turn-helix domain-containing protein [Streptomyces mobaraensis]|uniref:Helix-turn-helix domain-containing protein n=1 Tax=Streptomyces mobaraensis TaxID=35621 RepID=A0A5N5WAX5_STRMB|nr:helix-turn-helix domain-containing protein [Streptomyces mobaraensis]
MSEGIAEFAARLRKLKGRSGQSYGALAKRLHMSTSTLHRYCNGVAVPTEYAPVERFARLCGAAPDELVELHRRWIIADDARRRKAQATADAAPRVGADEAAEAGGARRPEAGSPLDAQKPQTPQTPPASQPAPEPQTPEKSPTDRPAPTADATTDTAPAAHPEPEAAAGDPAGPPAETPSTTPPPDPAPASTPPKGPEPAVSATPPVSAPNAAAPKSSAPGRVRQAIGSRRPGAAAGTATGAASARSAPTRSGSRKRVRRALIAAAVAVAIPAAVVASYAATKPDSRADTNAGEAPKSRTDRGLSADRRPGGSGAASTAPVPGLPELPSPGATAVPSVPSFPTGAPAPGGPQGNPSDTAREPAFPGPTPPRSGAPAPDAPSGAPLTVNVSPYALIDRCDQVFVTGRTPAEVPPPPSDGNARGWVTAMRAVPGGQTQLELAVQGTSRQAVVLRALHVRVVGRAAPLAWSAYLMADGCGSGVTPSTFDIDLDRDNPRARPVAGVQGDVRIPATDFPYKTSTTDPQVLDVVAHTTGHDVQWYLELEWSSGDRHGTLRIDDRGRPFRTTAIKDRPQYLYRGDTDVWETAPDYARR